MEESRDETQGKIRKQVFSSSSSSLVRKNRFKRAILIGKSGTPVTTPKMTMSRSPVFRKATEFVNERDGVVSARRLAASLWGMNEVSSPKESSRVVCSSNPETETKNARQQFKDARKALSTAKELVKVLTHILRQEEKHYYSSAKSLVSALRFELDRASAQVDQLAYAQRLHRREIKHLAAEKNKASRAVEMVAAELEAERKLRKQAERMNRKLGRELADGRARLDKVVIELENERKAKAVLELKNVEKERDHHMLQLGDVLRVDQMKVAEANKYHFEEKNAELEAYMSNDGVTKHEAKSPGSANTEILRDFLRKTLGKVCQNPNIEAENEDCWDESDMHLMELEKDESEKSYKWAYSLHDDDSRRSSVEVFKGRKSLSEKIQWATISLLKGS